MFQINNCAFETNELEYEKFVSRLRSEIGSNLLLLSKNIIFNLTLRQLLTRL